MRSLSRNECRPHTGNFAGMPTDLTWPNCLNARDLGGLPTADGSEIRPGALIRSDSHSKLTPSGVAAVTAYGVSRIIDLRRSAECVAEPSPFADHVAYRNLPVQDPADPDDGIALTLAQIYVNLIDRRPELFAATAAAIADAPPGGVVVHCAGGKDRTGIVVAMALTIAGVERPVIAADYAVTEERLRSESERYLARVTDEARRERIRALQATRPETMLETLEHVDSAYGGVSDYLAKAGFDLDAQASLRRRLVA
jgi:protein-tyrosine phosphatase